MIRTYAPENRLAHLLAVLTAKQERKQAKQAAVLKPQR